MSNSPFVRNFICYHVPVGIVLWLVLIVAYRLIGGK